MLAASHGIRTCGWLFLVGAVVVVAGFLLATGGNRRSDEPSFGTVTAVGLVAEPSVGYPPSEEPAFRTLAEAETPRDLVLFPDGQRTLGWVTGDGEVTERQVTIQDRDNTHIVPLGPGNVFVWEHPFRERTECEFRVAGLTRKEWVEPVIAAPHPAAFFVVDRTVFRPGQKLQFAAFLRRENEQREFTPVANCPVMLHLTSVSKRATAATLNLRSDELGRVVGEFAFSGSDPLDKYRLTINGFHGHAEVQLAEFRKAKVRLAIEGESKGQHLRLKFRALDFLDKPVGGSKVSFHARVVRNPARDRSAERTLDADKFVYADAAVASYFSLEDLSEDERLLEIAGQSNPRVEPPGATVLAELSGNVAINELGEAEWPLALERAWLGGDHSLHVEGVLLDYNGHEQRAMRLIPIGEKIADRELKLRLTKEQFEIGEPIRVRIEPTGEDDRPLYTAAAVIALKLSPATNVALPVEHAYQPAIRRPISAPHLLEPGPVPDGLQPSVPGLWFGANRADGTGAVAESELPRRTFVTAAVVKENLSRLSLDEPGAYQLVCIAELPDGRKLRNEIGCVVQPSARAPALILNLDREELTAGQPLTGHIHCRFDRARVLLTVRDSRGVQFWKVFAVRGGGLAFRESLPADLRYGCNVEVCFLESEQRLHAVKRSLCVVPTDRTIKIDIGSRETYEPRDEVTLDLQADRHEPLDLVVSVYDKSLLGIAADRAPNVRDFFLADERVTASGPREVLRRRLGGVKLQDLVDRIAKRLKDNPRLVRTPQGEILNYVVLTYQQGKQLQPIHLSSLLEEAGERPRLLNNLSHGWLNEMATRPTTLFELLDYQPNQRHVDYEFVGATLVLLNRNALSITRRPRLANDAMFMSSDNRAFSHVSGQAIHSHLAAPVATEQAALAVEMSAEWLADDTVSESIRRDFSDSAFWSASVRTDDRGRAKMRFKLPDSLTNWQVVVTAISPRMHVGQAKASFRTFRPIMVWPIIPRTFTVDDQVELFGSVHNRTDVEQTIEVALMVDNGRVENLASVRSVRVPAKGQVPVYWTYRPEKAGFAQLLMTARCPAGEDASLKRIPVTPLGAEQVVTVSGFARGEATVTVPPDARLADAKLEITFVPSLLDDAVQSLEYLVEYPYGCVEQTMSRFLPAIVVKQTLDRVGVRNDSLDAKLPGVVEGGIKRLLELQHADGGWGWHGGSEAHEMMTPYALYGLFQAQKAGYAIPNESAIGRGFERLRKFVDFLGEQQTSDRVYCLYVYSLHYFLKDAHWQFLEERLDQDKLSDYALAMALEMATARGRRDFATRLSAALHRRAQVSGDRVFWTTAGFSRWSDDRFEITAAVLKALVGHDRRDALIAPTLAFFADTKRNNRWNSTKDTAMIVYAICDCLKAQDEPVGRRGVIGVSVNSGEEKLVALEKGTLPRWTVSGRELRHGPNTIEFTGDAPGAMFRAALRHRQRSQDIQPSEQGVKVERRFYLLDEQGRRTREITSGQIVRRGSYVLSEVTAERTNGEWMRYVLVENPKPSACEILPRTDRRFPDASTAYALREDREWGSVFHHERTPAKLVDHCVLFAEFSGRYVAPPARVELMYDTLTRGHSGTFEFRVAK